MRSLIIGASGLVGRYLFSEITARGASVTGTYHRHALPGLLPLDATDTEAMIRLVGDSAPDIIYYPAANPNVEWIESEPEASWAVNGAPVEQLVSHLDRHASNTRLVYYSSDYVFDGVNGPYTETDMPNPICKYGEQKLAVEHIIQEHLRNYLVFRVTVVYGWEMPQAKNYVHRLVNQLRSGNTAGIRAPVDQIGNPSYAPNIARAAVELAHRAETGIYNLAGAERGSRFDFAQTVLRTWGFDPGLVQPVDTATLNQKAARPLNAGMDLSKATKVLDGTVSLAGYTTALQTMKQEEEVCTG